MAEKNTNEDIAEEQIVPTDEADTTTSDDSVVTEDTQPSDSEKTTEVEAVADTETKPEVASETDKPKAARFARFRGRKPALISVIIVLILAAGVTGFFLTRHKSTPPVAATTHKAKTVKKPAVNVAPVEKFTDDYLQTAVALDTRPNLFSDYRSQFGIDCSTMPGVTDQSTCPASVTADSMVYSQIGTTKAGQKIIIADNGLLGEDEQTFVVLQTGANTYSILGNLNYGLSNSPASNAEALKKNLDPSTTLDTTTNLPDLAFPKNFKLQKASFISWNTDAFQYTGYFLSKGLDSIRGAFYANAGTTSPVEKIGNYGAKTVYQVTAQDSANFSVKEIYMAVNQVYASSYLLDDGVAGSDENKTANFTWNDATKTKDSYSYRSVGCGSANGYIVAKNISESDLTSVGTGPDGKKVYELQTSSPLFQQIYTEDYADGTNLSDDSLKNLTPEQLQTRHVVVVLQNGLGEYVVYKDNNYFGGGGCAKPVVYLYPAQTESVNVAVGAKVTKSEPTYAANGWRNVLAQPNGKLTYKGKSYGNLFWEGTGLGSYPIVDSGTIVSSKNAVATIRTQLAQQGLNQQESADFLAYWSPRLPKTPYVRLTWFNTAQLNSLAPLAISPKPDTTIRVFLDSQGLNKPYAIPAQHLSASARKGFTVVEWGGLDRSTGDLR